MADIVEKARMTVTIQGVTVGKTPGKYNLSCEVPVLGTRFPTIFYGLDGELLAEVRAHEGQTVEAVVSKGNLKEGKDGRYDNQYFWNWHGLVGGVGSLEDSDPYENTARDMDAQQRAAPKPAAKTPAAPPQPYFPTPDDDRQNRIERQTVLKAAVELTCAYMQTNVVSDIADMTAYHFDHLLRLLKGHQTPVNDLEPYPTTTPTPKRRETRANEASAGVLGDKEEALALRLREKIKTQIGTASKAIVTQALGGETLTERCDQFENDEDALDSLVEDIKILKEA